MQIHPRRNLVLVRRVLEADRTRDAEGNERTAGGLYVPADYKARGSQKAVRKADHFRARVIAVGPHVKDPLVVPGAEVPILTWGNHPDGTRRSLYTGVDGPDGTLFVAWPDDFGGVVYEDRKAISEAAE